MAKSGGNSSTIFPQADVWTRHSNPVSSLAEESCDRNVGSLHLYPQSNALIFVVRDSEDSESRAEIREVARISTTPAAGNHERNITEDEIAQEPTSLSGNPPPVTTPAVEAKSTVESVNNMEPTRKKEQQGIQTSKEREDRG